MIISPLLDIEMVDNKPTIFVAGKKFNQCSFLVVTIPESTQVNSIDELVEIESARRLETEDARDWGMSDEEILFAHASNLQAWVENDYNTRILHSNLSFPLLKALAEEGDEKAARVLEAEVESRILEGHRYVTMYLFEELFEYVPSHLIDALIEHHRSECATCPELRECDECETCTIWMGCTPRDIHYLLNTVALYVRNEEHQIPLVEYFFNNLSLNPHITPHVMWLLAHRLARISPGTEPCSVIATTVEACRTACIQAWLYDNARGLVKKYLKRGFFQAGL